MNPDAVKSGDGSKDENSTRQRQRSRRVAAKSTRIFQKHYKNSGTRGYKKKELNQNVNRQGRVRRPRGVLYDENGVHIATSVDLCDCLVENCVGCFFPCSKCGSEKCGIDCRVHRKYIYEEIEYDGYEIVVKNPLLKK